jgi:ubiquinone/menaquinone biosynthesis C-methylase UbiE
VIRGGAAGRERLRFISGILRPGTETLLDHVGIEAGFRCLDVGSGGGDVTTSLARRAGSSGQVIGIDMDAEKVEVARKEAQDQGLRNVEFVVADLRDWEPPAEFDAVYARFVLTHLPDPETAVQRFYRWVRRGGIVVLEDIDYNGCFTFPQHEAFRRYHKLYCEVVRRRGGDPNIGPRLPQLLRRAGFQNISVALNQPIGFDSDVKLVHAMTLENITDAVVQASLATRDELQELIRTLYEIAADNETLASLPRIVQSWARRPREL